MRWELIAIVAAVLLAAAALVRRWLRRRAVPRPAPAPVSPIGPMIAVRARAGGSSAGHRPERPLEKGRVKIGVVMGAPRPPEPAAGAPALRPGQIVVRRVDDATGDPLGEHPQRVLAQRGWVRVRVDSGEPVEIDEGAEVLKRS